MPPRLENRFTMIIEVALGKGVKNLKGFKEKLAAVNNETAKSVKLIKDQSKDFELSKTKLKTFGSALKSVKQEYAKLNATKTEAKRVNNEEKAAIKELYHAMRIAETQLEKTRILADKKKVSQEQLI